MSLIYISGTFLYKRVDKQREMGFIGYMTFKSKAQSLFLRINFPELYKKWRGKYGDQYSKKKTANEQRYPDDKESVVKSHARIHSNFSGEDTTYYKRIHSKIVGSMKEHGITHAAYNGNVLDESLTSGLRSASKWMTKDD